MNIHQNARLTPVRREEMACSVIAGQLSKAQAAKRFGVSVASAVRVGQRQKSGLGQGHGKIGGHRRPKLKGEPGDWLLARLA